MKTALYIRVSTLDQNPDAQRRELEAYAARHGWPVVAVYEDKASGADPRRPELGRLLADAQAGKFQGVLVWKLDRIGRSLIDLLNIVRLLDTELVRVIAITQGIDTDQKNPASRFFVQILAAVAEFEKTLIRERCLGGQKRYQGDLAAGKVGRTVHSRSGKDLPPHRPRKVFDLGMARTLRTIGLSYAAIGEQMGVNPSTVCRRLRTGV